MMYANRTNVTRRRGLQPGEADQELANQAAALAGQGEWSAAAAINHEIHKRHPKDTSTLNRLGKCLTELGRHKDALTCYERVLQLDPQNEIARKNAARIVLLADGAIGAEPGSGAVDPGAFIADPGTSLLTTLVGGSDSDAWATSTPGAELTLREEQGALVVRDRNDNLLGSLAPQLGQRLLVLLAGGNRYSVVLASAAEGTVRVILRETFRHPSQAGRPSFPAREDAATLASNASPQGDSYDDEGDEDSDERTATANAADAGYPETDTGEEEPPDPFAGNGPVIVNQDERGGDS